MQKEHWGFDTRDLDASVRPQDDLYRYAGGNWLKKNEIPAAESRWGTFIMLRYETEKKLQNLVKEIGATRRVALGSPEQMVRDLYRSGMDMRTRVKRGLQPLAPYQKMIETVQTTDDLVRCIAELHTIGIGAVWDVGIDQDMKDSTKNILYLSQGGLGMPDRDYYLNDDAESRRVRTAYRPHVARMLTLTGMTKTEAAAAAETVFTIEYKLAQASMRKEDARDMDKIYHKKTVAGLARIAPKIAWKKYFSLIGAGKPSSLIVCQPDFFAAVGREMAELSIAQWRTYLSWHLLASFASFLTPEIEKQNFRFYGTVMAGVKTMRPPWRRVLSVTNAGLGELIGKVYVARYFTPETKRRVNAMVDDISVAYEARLRRLGWMSPATKKQALKKLHSMIRKIGYPARWKSYTGLRITQNDYAGNVLRTTRFEHRRAMRKLTKPVNRSEWYMNPQSVNAYYSFGLNDIVFPAAILQPPFFDPAADDAVNYGAIGMTIGHEMTHGFDDQGSKFDAQGNMKNWWTVTDRKRFMQKAQPLIKQFNTYTVAHGVRVNGKLTLGENIADLGGLSIAYDAYQRCLARTGRRDIGGFTPEQRFFLGFTLFEREKARPEIEKMLAINDPHSPAVFRINGPVSNLPEFYAAFGVKKGDKLYRAPKDRIKIW